MLAETGNAQLSAQQQQLVAGAGWNPSRSQFFRVGLLRELGLRKAGDARNITRFRVVRWAAACCCWGWRCRVAACCS